MEVQLASGFLPLLLLAWLPTGLTHQISAVIDVSMGLDVVLQCLLQTGLSSTPKVKWFNTTQNDGEKQNKSGVELRKGSAKFRFTSVNKAHEGSYTCSVENTKNMENTNNMKNNELNQKGTVSQTEESVITTECRFKIWLESLIVHVKWYKFTGLEVENQTNTMTLEENCASPTSPSVPAANRGICGCRVFITREERTTTENVTQGTVPSCGPGTSQTTVTKKETWMGLDFPLCVVFGFAVGMVLYMPIIVFLLCRCRRSRKGKLTSQQAAEGNQLSMAAPAAGTEDLTYANLRFEKKGTKPASSNVIYTEIKPSQQKQSGSDAAAADTGVDVCLDGEGK